MLVVLVGWAPLPILTIVHDLAFQTGGARSLLVEVGAHARYLIAAPLLILAEAQCAPKLGAIIRHFAEAGLVRSNDRARFDESIITTRALLDSSRAEFVTATLAYLVVAASLYSYGHNEIPLWHRSAGAMIYTPAGWWHVLVSLPLLLVLLFGWLWRLALWARLLWRISRLDLRLIASHPDRAAGLGFVGYSAQAFATVALAIATIAAGRSAHLVLTGGGLPTPSLYFNIGLLGLALAMFVAPVLILTPTLLRVWRRGAFEYGALAEQIGVAFEDKWIRRTERGDASPLQQPDFSATTDLYAIVANANGMRLVAIDIKSLCMLTGALLAPFAPVVLLAVPTADILQSLKGLLF